MNHNKSILFVHNGKGLGGAPKALRYIIEVCKTAGHECYVACLNCNQTVPYFKEAGAEVILVNTLPRYTNSTTVSYPVNSKQFQRERIFAESYAQYWRGILNDHGPFSIVFLNSMVLCDLIKPSKAAGCKVIQTIRETAQSGTTLTFMKEIIGEADAVLFISEYDRDLFSITSANTVVIPDAVDPTLYACDPDEKAVLRESQGLKPEDVVLLFTGGTGYIKGGELFLDSLDKVNSAHPVTVLFAGGSGAEGFKLRVKKILGLFSHSPRFARERIERKLSRLVRNARHDIRQIGYCSNIQDYYKMADICMVPYRVPHQAMPIFEAGMAKLPCIVSDFPCYQYEVKNSYNGYLLPVDNPDMWAKTIENLASDPDKRQQMGNVNYQMALARHDIQKNSANFLNLINKIISA